MDAKWIGYEILPDSMLLVPGTEDINSCGNKGLQRTTVPYFIKNFTAKKQIAEALAFVTGVGQYEFEVNGKKLATIFYRLDGRITTRRFYTTLTI